LTNRKPGEKAIATEEAPGANLGKYWGRGRDKCITFGLKMMGKVVELGARSRQVCAVNSANQTEQTKKKGQD
jgi:hypothetical protein